MKRTTALILALLMCVSMMPNVFAFTPDPAVIAEADSGILLPECDEICALFSASTAMQMFACALSTARGLNPDNPRGLSKVTITK